ncbi:phospholipase-like protein [Tanacetum coccineum]
MHVFIPINEPGQHWCLAEFDILLGVVKFYDSGDSYDVECRDWYIRTRDCLQGRSGRLPEVLDPVNVFDKKEINKSAYHITFGIAENVSKQEMWRPMIDSSASDDNNADSVTNPFCEQNTLQLQTSSSAESKSCMDKNKSRKKDKDAKCSCYGFLDDKLPSEYYKELLYNLYVENRSLKQSLRNIDHFEDLKSNSDYYGTTKILMGNRLRRLDHNLTEF